MLDLDIKNFFGSIDWELLMRAVRRHTDCAWVLLYIERWLKAPVQMADGTVVQPDQGTPQGSVISPVLANLFLHYAFDQWMRKHHPEVPFERYADDMICHCKSEAHARLLKQELEARLAECKLALHPDKTKIVFCKQANRRADRTMRQKMRRSGPFHRYDLDLNELADRTRPTLRGWIQYYGRFYRSALVQALRTVDESLVRWAQRKYKAFRRHKTKNMGMVGQGQVTATGLVCALVFESNGWMIRAG